jgi:glucosyl-3-phosphoglycerate synthase
MPDFAQNGQVTTLHDLNTADLDRIEALLDESTQDYKIGLVLPVTASDMRAKPFAKIVDELAGASYVDTIAVSLGLTESKDDYLEAKEKIAPLGDKAKLLWTDGPRFTDFYSMLCDSGFNLSQQGKGRGAWTAFGYLLADPQLKAFVLHDCDIVDYDRTILARLCLPMAHPSLDFDFCKAFYARATDRLHGRVVRLLVHPFLKALMMTHQQDQFLDYLSSFRYPLSGEFAVTSALARSNRIPSDWGLEVGTLAEVFRNTSTKKVCQVDLCRLYEHKHQDLSAGDPTQGLMKMAGDILTTIFRTLASRGLVLSEGHFVTLRSAYLRCAQDAIRQYHADAVINDLYYDRNAEESAVEGFADRVSAAGEEFYRNPAGAEAIPNWARVLAAYPDLPRKMRQLVEQDKQDVVPVGN